MGTIYYTGYDSSPSSVATGDLNNDNRFDVVVANNGTNNIAADYDSWDNQKCITSDKLCHYHNYSHTTKEGKEVCLYQPRISFLMKKTNVKFIENNNLVKTINKFWSKVIFSFFYKEISNFYLIFSNIFFLVKTH
jgi:hypothetical protein